MSDQFQRRYPILDRLVSIEAFLIQIVAYLLIWLLNDYLAFILSFILGGIALFLYLVAKIVELVDRSRVPKVYYRFMVICFLAPLLAGIVGLLLRNGPSWLWNDSNSESESTWNRVIIIHTFTSIFTITWNDLNWLPSNYLRAHRIS